MLRSTNSFGTFWGWLLCLIVWTGISFFSSPIPSPAEVISDLIQQRGLIFVPFFKSIAQAIAIVVVAASVVLGIALVSTRYQIASFLPLAAGIGYSIPLVVLVPVLALTLPSSLLLVVLALLAGGFPAILVLIANSNQAGATTRDVVLAFGGHQTEELKFITLPAMVRSLPIALRVLFPATMLGLLLSAFVGAEQNIGRLLAVAVWQGNTTRVLGIGILLSLFLSILDSLLVYVGRKWLRFDELAPSNPTPILAMGNLKKIAAVLACTLVIWEGLARFTNLPYIVKGPAELTEYVIRHPEILKVIFARLTSTLTNMFFVLTVSVATIFIAVSASILQPWLRKSIFAICRISESVPLVALMSMVCVVFGRGWFALMVFGISATLFPSLSVILDAVDKQSPKLREVVKSYGGTAWEAMLYVDLPCASAEMMGALHVVGFRALLACVLYEFLATHNGLGGLLFDARGSMDFEIIWVTTAITALISMVVVLAFQALDKRVRPGRLAQS